MMFTRSKIVPFLLTLGAIVAVTGCEVGEDFDDQDPAVQEERLGDPTLVVENEPESSSSGELLEAGYCPGCANCVYRARCLQPRLPLGLTTWGEKLGKINSHTPRSGCVAMIYTGSQWGHVAFVDARHADGTITIREGNWVGNTCSSRRRTPAALNVRGYWCPGG
jgi:hypothetical protein